MKGQKFESVNYGSACQKANELRRGGDGTARVIQVGAR